ncbi:CAP domain-containing protein [Blastococcus saxobsidens]|uniref:Uncharacterized protein YkwD n=1 Tax=Blastococcus saxobsidens TaxID=138336 RepID=A0A4Q7Y8N7_9ACTN|nr:CAP domain-containing protein [Blastococcus saxobsidens]RZU33118.1 uncharacterized protein YkwD [Blastococcus saxobsidens]
MHHRPAGPPLSVRLSAAVRRIWLLLRLSGRRVALGAVATVAVTAVLLAVPVTVNVPEVLSLDPSAGSSSSSSSSSSPASSASSAGRSSAESSTSVFPEQPLPSTTTPGTGPAPSAAAPEPAPVEEPAPAPEVTAPRTPADAPTTSPSPSAAATTPRETPPAAPAPAPAPAAVVTPAALGDEAEVLSLVNAARADAGCGALVADPGLAAVARAHSADMRDRGFFAHVNLAGQDPFQRAAAAGVTARAENIARGQQDAAGVMASWMDSPGHRANILDCDLRSLGVGVADGAGGPWWTQIFG